MTEIRQIIGVCPQHNVLVNELTTSEHLYLYAGIKGVPTENTEAEVSSLYKLKLGAACIHVLHISYF